VDGWPLFAGFRGDPSILRSLLEMSGRNGMSTAADTTRQIPWWKEPTKDQWIAWWAAWLGWTLDAFDFTIFLLIMVPISQEFGVPMTEVALS
jgi:SHS family lactate transporter-like MFS transporter